MKRYLLLPIPLFLPAAGLAASGDGESPVLTEDGGGDLPADFEALRESLREQLEDIGVNIGALPDDVRE